MSGRTILLRSYIIHAGYLSFVSDFSFYSLMDSLHVLLISYFVKLPRAELSST